MNCDMCGKEGEMYRAVVEGVGMNVCPNCAKFGRVIRKAEAPRAEKPQKKEEKEEEPEVVETIVGNYAQLVKKAREKAGLKQEDVAKRINEKESLMHQVESGHIKPPVPLARKLEKFFHITLVEEITLEKEKKKSGSEPEGLTIGDLLRKK